jgi:hypothetical protein
MVADPLTPRPERPVRKSPRKDSKSGASHTAEPGPTAPKNCGSYENITTTPGVVREPGSET